jgi:hypothetical protein
MNGNDKFVGTWKLLSVASVTTAGTRNPAPYGRDPAGLLTYTEDGRVSAMISFDGRKPIAIGAKAQALLEQQAEAFKTFLAYAGQYRIEGDNVIHSVEVSSVQNWVHTELARRFSFHEDQLVLLTPPTMSGGKIQTFELVWQRLRSDSAAVT